MSDRTADLNVQLADVPWCAIALLERSDGQHACLKKALGLHLHGMPETQCVGKGNDARSHGEASLAFRFISVNIR